MTATATRPDGVDHDERYTIISADCHAGGSHKAYREYLDPAFLDDFDAWRGKYKNPYKDLGDNRRLRNWDNEMRNGQQEQDGIAGEVVFPNTVPPFFPSFVLFAKPPTDDEYAHRHAGVHAHNRWLVDWCGEFPERRAGVGQIFLNDVDDAIADVRWIKDHGLRGGVLLPNIAPDVKWVKPLYDRCYDPLWEVLQDLEVPVNVHSGTGNPDYGAYPVSMLLYINEVPFYTERPLVQLILSGVFERFPRLKFVMTEAGCAWVPPLLDRLDRVIRGIRETGATGEIRYGEDHVLHRDATEYFHQNVLDGREPARAGRCRRPTHDRHRPVHVGQRLPPRRRHVPLHPREPAGPLQRRSRAGAAQDPGRQRRRAVRLRPRRPRPAGRPHRTHRGRGGHPHRRGTRQDPGPDLRRHGHPGHQVSQAPPEHARGDLVLVDEPAPMVRRFTLNRPSKRNALNHKLRGDLIAGLQEADRDPDIRVSIIRGAGSCFSAGYELGTGNEGLDLPHYTAEGEGHWPRHVTETWMGIWDLAKPVIAQVHGYCLAGGSELATGCDLVYVAEDAQMGYPAVRFGVPDMHFHAWFLGMRAAMEMMLTGDSISGVEAVRLGWANRAFPAADLAAEVLAIAERIALIPTDISSLNKRTVHRAMDAMGMRTAIRQGTELCALGTKAATFDSFIARSRQDGLTQALQDRDAPFGDYRTAAQE